MVVLIMNEGSVEGRDIRFPGQLAE